MKTFGVWLRPSGGDCQVGVDGMQNARWLLDKLAWSFVFKTCEPIHDDVGTSQCTFRVSFGPRMSPSVFVRLLSAIPEVRLMAEPG